MLKLYQLIIIICLFTTLVNCAKYFETKRCLIECKHDSHSIKYCQHLNSIAFKLCLMNKRDLPKNCVRICTK